MFNQFRLSAMLLCAALLFGGATAHAGGDPDDAYSATATFDLQARNQPLGSLLKMRFYNEYEFMRGNVSPFFDPVWFRAGALVNLSPDYGEVGIDLQVSPIRLFELRVEYAMTRYFGLLYYIYSFDTPTPQTDDDGIDEIDGQEESGFAHRVVVEPTFQIALGSIALQNKFTYARHWFPSGEFDGPFIREPSYDRILKLDGDSILTNSLMFLYKVWDPDGDGAARMLLGPFHEWTRSVGTQQNRHRVGLTYVVIPRENWGKLLLPRLLVQAGYNIVDRENNREGHIFVQGGVGFNLQLAR